MSEARNIVLLGATGSIGDSTLKVIRKHPDRLRLVGIAAKQNVEKLATIAKEFGVGHIGIDDDTGLAKARDSGEFREGTKFYGGQQGLEELASLAEADTTLVAIVGTKGLLPALSALRSGKRLAVASKEILVLAGKFVMQAARENSSEIVPVDSEHSALFQCLEGIPMDQVSKLILTASGGSFRDLPLGEFANVTLEQALKHPNWDMGPKVTLDSATMANKGLEMIEARWLFGAQPEQIDVVIHKQSIIHSMVQCLDGSIMAQLSPPEMTFAIQHALLHPFRAEGTLDTLDFSKIMQLDLQPVDLQRYPCLRLARNAMETCGIAPAVFNAANEIAVEGFVNGRIKFIEIAQIIEKTLESVDYVEPNTLGEVLAFDSEARQVATSLIETSN